MEKSYSIGETAKMFNLTVSTLRYYDELGLIPNLKKNNSGIREFNEANLEALNIIKCLKISGMKMKDIKKFIDWSLEGDATLNKRKALFNDLYLTVNKQMKELQNTLEILDYKRHYYDQATQDGTEKYVMQVQTKLIPDYRLKDNREIK